METEMTQAERVRQSQLALARGMKLMPENLKVLEKVSDWITREWLYVCALDGMDIKQISESDGQLTVKQIRMKREEYFREKFGNSKDLYDNLEQLQHEVEKTCKENRQVKKAVLEMLEKGNQNSREQQKEQEEILREKEEEIRGLNEQLREIREKQARDRKEEEKDAGGGCSHGKAETEKFSFRLFLRKVQGKRQTADVKKFIQNYIEDERYSSAQIEYMLRCMEEGMKIKDIEKFAIPGASVDLMKRLRNLN